MALALCIFNPLSSCKHSHTDNSFLPLFKSKSVVLAVLFPLCPLCWVFHPPPLGRPWGYCRFVCAVTRFMVFARSYIGTVCWAANPSHRLSSLPRMSSIAPDITNILLSSASLSVPTLVGPGIKVLTQHWLYCCGIFDVLSRGHLSSKNFVILLCTLLRWAGPQR